MTNNEALDVRCGALQEMLVEAWSAGKVFNRLKSDGSDPEVQEVMRQNMLMYAVAAGTVAKAILES